MAQADSAYDSEDWLEASNRYREVLDKIPDDAYAWFRMGNSLTQLGRYGEAVVAYETSLATDNAQFKAWFNLSTTHLLNAKVVTLNALRSIGMNDPSRNKVERRLDVLTALLN
jgi:Flp pilus assembly protein TadD